MSDIPLARKLFKELLLKYGTGDISTPVRRQIALILPLLDREKYVRRAPAQRKTINKNLRARIKRLVHNTDLTYHQIANKVGVRSSGRVSDVMHGKR